MEDDVVNARPAIRIVCDESSHRECVVATFRREASERGARSSWFWDYALAEGGQAGVLNRETGEREGSECPTYITQADIDAGYRPPGRKVSPPKRLVADESLAGPYDLECPKCGLRRRVNRDRLHTALEKLTESGVSRLGLASLVAIV